MLWLYIFLGILVFLLIVTLLLTYIFYRIAFYNERKGHEPYLPMRGAQYATFYDESKKMIDHALSLPFQEEINIKSKEGKILHGRFYQGKGNDFVILFHGYKDAALRDFSGGLPLALNHGLNVILVDQRGHGKSHGRTISFGIKEQYDVDCWIDYVNNRFHSPKIVIQGISMGAATVLLASNHSLPDNVKGIMADCPYASVKSELLYSAKKMKLNPKLIYPFLLLSGWIYGHFDIRKGEVFSAVKNCKLPILLIHGTDDHMVPYDSAIKISKASSLVQLETFEGAPHGLSYLIDTKRYKRIVNEFYDSVGLKQSE